MTGLNHRGWAIPVIIAGFLFGTWVYSQFASVRSREDSMWFGATGVIFAAVAGYYYRAIVKLAVTAAVLAMVIGVIENLQKDSRELDDAVPSEGSPFAASLRPREGKSKQSKEQMEKAIALEAMEKYLEEHRTRELEDRGDNKSVNRSGESGPN